MTKKEINSKDNICIGELNDTIRSFTEAVDLQAYCGDLSRFMPEPLQKSWSERKLIELVGEDFHFKDTTIRPGIVYGYNYVNTNYITDAEKFKELIDTALDNCAHSLCWQFEDNVEFYGAICNNHHYFPRLYLLVSDNYVYFGWSLWYALVKEGKNKLPLECGDFYY